MSREVNREFLRDLIWVFLGPNIFNKILLLYFGHNYAAYPGEGYGYGLAVTILILLFTMGRFLWKYRHEEDP